MGLAQIMVRFSIGKVYDLNATNKMDAGRKMRREKGKSRGRGRERKSEGVG